MVVDESPGGQLGGIGEIFGLDFSEIGHGLYIG
jgi:hypothetical protein